MTIDQPTTFSTDRLKALTDGVIAIVITLLVLQLTIPVVSEIPGSEGLWPELRGLWREVLGYAVSFFVVGLLWLYHHSVFRYVRRANGTLLTLNVFFLFAVSITPFSSALVTANPNERLAAIIYGSSIFLAAATNAAMFAYAARRHRLVDRHLQARFIRRENGAALGILLVLAIGAALGYIGSTYTYAVLGAAITYYWIMTALDREGASAARRGDHGVRDT